MLGPVYLDTSAIIEFLKGNNKVKKILEKASEIYIGTIQIYELFLGEFYLEEKGYKSKIEELRSFILGLNVIKFNEEDATLAAKIMAKLRVTGNIINDIDVLIAAQSINRNITLITKDKDFKRLEKFGLKVIYID